MLRVVGYCRVSTEQQAKEGQSLEAQEESCRAYARAHGMVISHVYRDGGASAKNTDREALSALRANLDLIDAVIVYKFDRISRSVVDLYELLGEFESSGVEFKSVCEGVDTGSAIGKFVMNILAGLAQMERELIAERTKHTLAHKKTKGEHCGRPPFGFKIDDNGYLEKRPDQQLQLQRIKRLRRSGKTVRDISRLVGVSSSTVGRVINVHLGSLNAKYLKRMEMTTVPIPTGSGTGDRRLEG